jgi:hypothetical protein
MVTQIGRTRKSILVTFDTAATAPVPGESRIAARSGQYDRASVLNVAMLLLLAAWLVGEIIIEGTAYTLVAIAPAARSSAVPPITRTWVMLQRPGCVPRAESAGSSLYSVCGRWSTP